MRSAILLVNLFILTSLLAGCSNGIHSGTGGWPPASSSSPAVSSSDQAVKLSAPKVTIGSGGSTDAVVALSILPGFHVNANPASFSYLIATELQPGKLDGVATDKPSYPPAVKKNFQFAPEPLAVYEGDVQIRLPLRAASAVKKGAQSLPFKVRVQACDDEKCYPPVTLDGTIPITID
jgi:Disulphide bond corrector protein DsbC